MFREYITANLATEPGDTTRIGSHCLLMAYSHVAHNCAVGDHVIIANAVQMAGYVVVDDWAIVGGGTVVHQFTRIGRHSMIGGGSRIPQDVAPFVKSAGSPPRNAGINSIGLERRGFLARDRARRSSVRTASSFAMAAPRRSAVADDPPRAAGDPRSRALRALLRDLGARHHSLNPRGESA